MTTLVTGDAYTRHKDARLDPAPIRTMRQFGFNTGVQYTQQGQRIAAAIMGNGSTRCVFFADADRNVDGKFCCPDDRPFAPRLAEDFRALRDTVVRHYWEGDFAPSTLPAEHDFLRKLAKWARDNVPAI